MNTNRTIDPIIVPLGDAFGLSIGDRLLYTLSREELISLSLSINDALYGVPVYLDEKGGEQ